MKNRGTTALIVLFFAGLIGLWVADWLQVPSAAERDRHRGRVLVGMINVRPDDVHKVEIVGGAGPRLVFERRADRRWQMTAPLDVAADPSLLEGLAFRLKELTRKPQADTLPDNLTTYGLAPPARTINLWGASTSAPLATLDLGRVSADRRFVRAGAGAGVEVVPAQGLEVVDLPPVRWRDREVFRVPTFEVDAVAIAAKNHEIQFERGPDAWRIVAPVRALAVEAKIEGLIASLGSLRITNDDQFVANEVGGTDPERYGLKDPVLTVTVRAGRGPDRRPPQILRVGKPVESQANRLYAQICDQNDVIAVDSRVLNELTGLDPNQFRSEKIADIAPNRATRFRVENGDQSFDLARSGNDWFLTRPTIARADSKAVQEFFQTLEGLKTSLYLPPSQEATRLSGLDKPAEVIQVWQTPDPRSGTKDAQGEQPTLTLKIGNRDAGKKALYAQIGGDPTTLVLPDTAAINLFKNSWAFRDRVVLTAATDKIEQIKFAGLGKQVTIHAPPLKLPTLKSSALGWWMSEPVAALADDEAVGKLLKLLGELRVDGYAAEQPTNLAAFGLDAPALRVTWSVPPTLSPSPVPLPPVSDPVTRALRFDEQTLLVGGVVPERTAARYAMLVGNPVVFILGGETLATLDAEWHKHRILAFEPNQVETIHLTWPGTNWSFDLTRAGGSNWSIVGPVDVPNFELGATAAIVRAAGELTTTRYAQYRGEIPSGVGLTPARLILRFGGPKLPQPVELAIGGAIDGSRSYAAVPDFQPGAVFLIANAPFAPWLKLQPPSNGELPDDVFLREAAAEPARDPVDRPGQGGGQTR